MAILHNLIAYLKQKYPSFGRVVHGTPLVLVDQGQQRAELMKRMGVLNADIAAMMRDHGFERMEQIGYAVLERNGEISVLPGSQNK